MEGGSVGVVEVGGVLVVEEIEDCHEVWVPTGGLLVLVLVIPSGILVMHARTPTDGGKLGCHATLLQVVEIQVEQVLRVREQDRGREGVRHHSDQTDGGRGGEQGPRDVADERHGEVSGQPGEVEGLDIDQRRKDVPNLVERASWVQGQAVGDPERVHAQIYPLKAVEEQQRPGELLDMLRQARSLNQCRQKGFLPRLHIGGNVVALQAIGRLAPFADDVVAAGWKSTHYLAAVVDAQINVPEDDGSADSVVPLGHPAQGDQLLHLAEFRDHEE